MYSLSLSLLTGVDPLAAERIVRYLKELKPTQGLLFASHRIDECISTCNRVLMLVEGSVYFDGSVHAFDELASLFYQVDLVLPTSSTSTSSIPIPVPVPSSTSSYPLLNPPITNSIVDTSSFSSSLSSQELLLHTIDRERNVSSEARDHGEEKSVDFDPPIRSPSESIILAISLRCGGLELLERIVEYSPTLVRLTFEKRLVPLTKIWNILGDLRRDNVLEKYSFRTMGMEEALATIIASSKGL